MRYIPHTQTDIRGMLSAIGIQKVDELFHSIPEALRLEAPLNLPPALPEADLTQVLNQLGNRGSEILNFFHPAGNERQRNDFSSHRRVTDFNVQSRAGFR